jgi:glucosylceramidase
MLKPQYLLPALCLLIICSSINQQLFAQQQFSAEGKNIIVYTTADSTNLKLTQTAVLDFKDARPPLETDIVVFVNPDKQFQEILGIGGAVTDAAVEVFAGLPADKQQELLNAYYDKQAGIGYSLMRTNINSCDFSSESYTYVTAEDKELKTFSIAHDKQYRIPLIKLAIEKAGEKITIFASPWSPPSFMKDNKNMLKGGKLLPEYYQSWADYFTKFIKAYAAEGIPVWGITIQNEPLAVQSFESCNYTAEEERDFLKNYLGPTMVNHGLGDKKIIIWDHNRDFANHWADVIYSDSAAAKYAWGLGFHWYETWTGSEQLFDNIAHVRENYPGKNILFTEGCVEKSDSSNYFYWPKAERYGRSMINDFNNGTCGWTDWNILLDEHGGPNHVGNFCSAPVHADTKTGNLIYTPSYYYIGHFSKFVRPGARRVSATSNRSDLLTTSFLNENGKMATIVMNQSDQEMHYSLYTGSKAVDVIIPQHAIQTLLY